MSANVDVKGKITVSFTREKNAPFENGVIRLKNSSGKIVKEIESGKTGVVVFDNISAGSYTIEGNRKGESRIVQKSAKLGAGEFVDVVLRMQLDTPVTITVQVKTSDGSAFANQSLVLWRSRPSEGDEEIPVTTNDKGIFTASNIFPNQDWKLKQDGKELATFGVAPTGQSQTINVQTSSN